MLKVNRDLSKAKINLKLASLNSNYHIKHLASLASYEEIEKSLEGLDFVKKARINKDHKFLHLETSLKLGKNEIGLIESQIKKFSEAAYLELEDKEYFQASYGLRGLSDKKEAKLLEDEINRLAFIDLAEVSFMEAKVRVRSSKKLTRDNLYNLKEAVKNFDDKLEIDLPSSLSYKFQYNLMGLTCPVCSKEMERRLERLTYLNSAKINFSKAILLLDSNQDLASDSLEEINHILGSVEEACHLELDEEKNLKMAYKIENLCCKACSKKINDQLNALDFIEASSINFANSTLYIRAKNKLSSSDFKRINKIVKSFDDRSFVDFPKLVEEKERLSSNKGKFKINHLGCANCAKKMEEKINDLAYVEKAEINFMRKSLSLETSEEISRENLEEIAKIISSIEDHAKLEIGDEYKYAHKAENKEEKVNKPFAFKFKNPILASLIMASAIFLLGILAPNDKLKNFLYIGAFLVSGYSVIKRAIRNAIRLEIQDESLLMTIATIGAILLGESMEGASVMIFYNLGEYLQDLAVEKSRKSISALMDIKAEYANLVIGNSIETVDPTSLRIGDIIIVKAGEKIPVDSKIIEGRTELNTIALTGESLPRQAMEGDLVLSGSVNINSLIKLEVVKTYENSQVAKILELVESSGAKKARAEKFVSKFAKAYTPIVMIIALAIAVIPSIIIGNPKDWLNRAFVFLVASCPCALLVSVPLGFFAGMGKASKEGLLVKGASFIETASKVDTILFDKTGTLTKGKFKITDIVAEKDKTKEQILKYAYICEKFSIHPIAEAIKEAYQGEDVGEDYQLDNIGGKGLKANYKGELILAGNSKLLRDNGIEVEEDQEGLTMIYIGVDGKLVGKILLEDELKEDTKEAIEGLKKLGIKELTMLTGDGKKIGEDIANRLGLTDFKAELLPEDKLEIVEEKIKENTNKKVMVIGDGINDAPALVLSDIGVSMGSLGSDAAIEASDVVITNDSLTKLLDLFKISKLTMSVVYQNIIFALAFKLIVLALGVFGYASMWLAVFSDVGVTLLAVLNSMRILK